MGSILVFAQHERGRFSDNTLGALAKAASLGREVVGFVAGSGVEDALAAGLGGHGAARVLVADDPALESGLPQPVVDALAPHAEGAELVLFGAGVVAADVAAALAARLRCGINCETTDIVERDGELRAVRPALADSVLVESAFAGTPGIALARANAFPPADGGAGTAPVERVEARVQEWSGAARLEGTEEAGEGGVDIAEADVLVAFGRGLGSADNISVAEELARALGGTVAATRAVVDAGWCDYSLQVGQTGKTVSPKLYVALGISGAIQHKVGMAGSGVIVAVNKDANAPIFDYADLGVVGDALAVAPKLAELVKARRG
jgi:electron transfer flavoprotein alpha subunit